MSTAQPSINTTLEIKRTFAAKRERVFRAWTDARELSRWFAPSADYSAVVPELELRVGGRYRVEMHHKGGNVHSVSGAYTEIKPPERVAFTWQWDGDTNPEASLVTVEFHDLGNSTEVAITHVRLPNLEERDKHAHGWNGCLERLATFVQAG